MALKFIDKSFSVGDLWGRAVSWLLLGVGVFYLVWAASAVAYSTSMDYAVVVDMARNMAAGTDFPTFFYGQAYMGSLEPAVSALLCRLFGPSPFCVCLGSALLGVAIFFVTMRIGRKLAGEWGGAFSLLLAMSGGFYWIHFLVSPRGGYALGSLLVVSAIGLAALARFTDPETGGIRLLPAAVLGLIAGLAFWNFWLVFPALAGAGAVILLRIRRRAFSPHFIVPFLVAFLIGSAPWWIWTLRNGGGALDMGGGGLKPTGLRAIYKIFSLVLVQFFSTSDSPAAFWRSPLPWTLAVLLVISLAATVLRRRPSQLFFLAGTALYTAAFGFVYAKSAFGTMGVPRYLVPFVPVFSIVCGSALATLLPALKAPRSRFAIPRLVCVVLLLALHLRAVALPAARVCVDSLQAMRLRGAKWMQTVDQAVQDPSLAEAAFADFSLFGYNWASGRRLCFVSPGRWRYQPYLDRLEEAAHPAVINNMNAFRTFCNASGGTCRDRWLGDLVVTDQVVAPQETEELADPSGVSIRTPEGTEVAPLLFDDNLSTGVRIRGNATQEPFLDVAYDPALDIVGVSILMDCRDCARGWQADFFDADGNLIPGVVETPHQGWYWSGPRPYQFGPESRWTIRWPAGRCSGRLRLTFTSRRPGAPLAVHDLRLLTGRPLPTPDVAKVRDAVAHVTRVHPDARIHAGRWLGRQLGAVPDSALRFGRAADDLGLPEVCRSVTLDGDCFSLLVFTDPNVAGAATGTLHSCGRTFERTFAGGCHLITVSPASQVRPFSDKTDSDTPLRFMAGRLMKDSPPPLDTANYQPVGVDFAGLLELKGVGPLPRAIRPGDVLQLDTVWAFSPQDSGKRALDVFVHGVKDGQIVFQAKLAIFPGKARRPADHPHPAPMTIIVPIPPNTPSGEVQVMLCVKKDYPWSSRLTPVGKGVDTASRRVVLGRMDVADGTQDADNRKGEHP